MGLAVGPLLGDEVGTLVADEEKPDTGTHDALTLSPKHAAGPQHDNEFPVQSPHKATQFSSAPSGNHIMLQEVSL